MPVLPIAARDGAAWSERMEVSAAELRAARVAGAAHRLRTGSQLGESDRQLAIEVAAGLHTEAKVLRGQETANSSNEIILAFAGAAAQTLRESPSTDVDIPRSLDKLADQLSKMADLSVIDSDTLEYIEEVFQSTSDRMADGLGRAGDEVVAMFDKQQPAS